MKLTWERDIEEFQGKDWRERASLRREACLADPRIRRRLSWEAAFNAVIFMVVLGGLMSLRKSGILPSLWWVLLFYFAMGLPVALLFRAIWINPLIKEALKVRRA